MEKVLITGASRGIGLGLAEQFLTGDYEVYALVRTHGDEIRALAKKNPKLKVFEADVTDRKSLEAVAKKIDGSLDILINNAGRFDDGNKSLLECSEANFVAQLETNVVGPFRTTQVFLPLLKKSDNPRIVNVSSVMGSFQMKEMISFGYSVSKAALNRFTVTLSRDLAREEIVVISLHPGWVQTDMGGKEAPVTIENSTAGIKKVIEELTPKNNGSFLDYRGRPVSW